MNEQIIRDRFERKYCQDCINCDPSKNCYQGYLESLVIQMAEVIKDVTLYTGSYEQGKKFLEQLYNKPIDEIMKEK